MKKNITSFIASDKDKLPKVKLSLIILFSIVLVAVVLLIFAVIYSHSHPGSY